MERREFIKNTALASSLLMVPSFVKAFDTGLAKALGYKKLVIIQLSGGNDGLNTIVPFRNDIYYKNRPNLGIRSKDLIKFDGDIGLNSNMQGFKRLFDQGYVSILNNVGYPNPDRSHFRSLDIWNTASSSSEYLQTGWIGRFFIRVRSLRTEISPTASSATSRSGWKAFRRRSPRIRTTTPGRVRRGRRSPRWSTWRSS